MHLAVGLGFSQVHRFHQTRLAPIQFDRSDRLPLPAILEIEIALDADAIVPVQFVFEVSHQLPVEHCPYPLAEPLQKTSAGADEQALRTL